MRSFQLGFPTEMSHGGEVISLPYDGVKAQALLSFRAFRCDAHEPSYRLTKPPDDIVTATIGLLAQEHAGQIEDIWAGILRETQQSEASWDWAYKLRLAVNRPVVK